MIGLEILSSVLLIARELFGDNVYDGVLPPEGTKYPFVYIGGIDSNDTPIKNGLSNDIQLRVHFYTNDFNKRGSFIRMIEELITKLKEDANFDFSYDYSEFVDDSKILNGILTISTTIYK